MKKIAVFALTLYCAFIVGSSADVPIEIDKPIREIQTSCGSIGRMLFTKDRSKILVAGFNHSTLNTTVALYNATTGEQLHQFLQYNGATALEGIGFNRTEDKIYILRTIEIGVWDANSGEHLITHYAGGQTYPVNANIEFSAIAHISWDHVTYKQTIEFYDLDSAQLIYSIAPPIMGMRILTFTNDAKYFIVQTGPPANHFYVIDTLLGQSIATLKDSVGFPQEAAFSPDGTRVLGLSGEGQYDLKLWDRETGDLIRLLMTRKDRVSSSFQFSPDGTKALWGGERTYLIDVESGRQLAVIGELSPSATGVEFSDGEKQAVTGHADGAIRWWDIDREF